MNIKQLKLCTNIQPTSLTISGKVIEKVINPQEKARKNSLRDIMNAILYINKTGCQWRLLPREFGPWQTVYYYFRKWKFEGVFDDIMDTLHSLVRKLIGREESPSMGIIDSRSVKTSHYADPSCKGIDGNKQSKDARNILWLTHLASLWQLRFMRPTFMTARALRR